MLSRIGPQTFFLPLRREDLSKKSTFKNNAFYFLPGIQVAKAHPGNLVLDILVKHADSVSSEQAFNIFKEEVLKAPASTTRVQNILKVIFIHHFN